MNFEAAEASKYVGRQNGFFCLFVNWVACSEMMTLKLSKWSHGSPPDDHAAAKINALFVCSLWCFVFFLKSNPHRGCRANQSIRLYSAFLGMDVAEARSTCRRSRTCQRHPQGNGEQETAGKV
jgi:hypothetical protein